MKNKTILGMILVVFIADFLLAQEEKQKIELPQLTLEQKWRTAEWEAIADYLGLEYEQKVEGDWIVFTVTKKQ